MHRIVSLCSSVLLLVFVFSFVAPTPVFSTSRASTKKPTTKYYDSYGSGYGSKNKGYGKGYGKSYGKGYDGYLDDKHEIGDDGIDPRKDGQDYGDFGPIYDNKRSMLSSLNVWIYEADDWEQEGWEQEGSKYNGGRGKNYKDKNYKKKNYKDKNYNDDDDDDNNYKGNNYKGDNYKDKDYKGKNDKGDNYNKDSRKKRSYSKIRFPVKHIPNYRQFPIRRFPPLISIFPWVPIFYDKLTYQTIIFSPSGGLYIIPPLINFYGQRFAVAQLIKWGYASLVSTGAPVGPGLDVAPLVQPPPPPPAGGAAPAPAPVAPGPNAKRPTQRVDTYKGPTYDTNKGRFNGGVKTDFPNFKPRYSQTLDEGDSNYGSSSNSNSGVDSNYGGTRNQQVYPQGGPQNGGGGFNNQ